MADDDEIDVMGDFNLDNILSKEDGRLSCYDGGGVLGSQNMSLLQCEYGLPSQWLLDNTTQPCWYSTSDEQRSPNSDPQQPMFPNVSLSDPGMASSDDGEGWTDKEKRLLDRGIELFGRSPSRLAQFIGSKSPQQVRSYLRSHPQNFSDDLHVDFSNGRGLGFTELIDDFQIPVSVEEVIATVSTAQPTILTIPAKQNTGSATHETPHRKGNNMPKLKKLQLPTHNKQSALSRLKKIKSSRKKRHHLSTVRKRTPVSIMSEPVTSVSCEENNEVPTILMTGTNRGVILSSGEEVIKIQKEDHNDSDEDGEIEIGDFDTVVDYKPILDSSLCLDVPDVKSTDSQCTSLICNDEIKSSCDEKEIVEELVIKKCDKCEEIILDLPIPTEEVVLNPDVITDDEKKYHYEFFEGRSVKTPKRYLKIRNHIIECWRSNKPMYVTKTHVRTGLKSCGDVNYIGRIHAYLEQIGAINFGCDQVYYVRPLRVTLNNVPSGASGLTHARKKLSEEQLKLNQQVRTEGVRQRKKKVFPDCWAPSEGEGGYTITHSEDGQAIQTEVFSKEPGKSEKAKRKVVVQQKLVYCSKFDESKPAPFSVNLSIESLLIMDLHAHCSHSEVIGLLGGQYDAVRRILHIYRSYPCRSSSSGVHCEMCPVAQKEVSEKLQGEGYEVVGWYHSHPTFFPNPSLQDLDTQTNMQTWMTKSGAPFVSFIFSPYCPTSKNVGSEYRCLIVEKCEEDGQSGTPYRLSVDIISTGLDIDALAYRAKVIFSLLEEHSDSDVDFSKEYKDHILYFDKCVGSAKHHISHCKPPLSEEVKLELLETYSGIIELMVSFSR